MGGKAQPAGTITTLTDGRQKIKATNGNWVVLSAVDENFNLLPESVRRENAAKKAKINRTAVDKRRKKFGKGSKSRKKD